MRITLTTAKTLKAFLADPGCPQYGFQIMRATGMHGGTVYPILARLEAAGWATSTWENLNSAEEGRPPRRLYVLTAKGVEEAESRLAALSELFRPPA